jgi:hypothetical protein
MRRWWLPAVIAVEVLLLAVQVGALAQVGAFLPYGSPAAALRPAAQPVMPLQPASPDSPAPPDLPDPLHCPYQIGPRTHLLDNAGAVICAAQVRDAIQRRALSADDRAAMSADVRTVQALVRQADPRTAKYCVSIQLDPPPLSQGANPLDSCLANPSDPSGIASQLILTGYHDPVVRRADWGDVGPPGSIVFAVPVGPGCVLGYDGAWRSAVAVGFRFDGSCLSG